MNDVHRRPFKIFLEAEVFKKLFCSRYGLSESRLPSQFSATRFGQDISDLSYLRFENKVVATKLYPVRVTRLTSFLNIWFHFRENREEELRTQVENKSAFRL